MRALVLTDRELSYRAAATWLQAHGLEPRCVLAPSPWFDEFLKRERPPQARETLQVFAGIQPGEVLLWDSREAASPRHGLNLDELRGRADFVELWHSGGGPYDAIYCAIFEKREPAASLPTKDDPR